MFVESFVQAQIKENMKVPRHWPLWGESTGDRGFSLQQRASNTANVSIWWRHHVKTPCWNVTVKGLYTKYISIQVISVYVNGRLNSSWFPKAIIMIWQNRWNPNIIECYFEQAYWKYYNRRTPNRKFYLFMTKICWIIIYTTVSSAMSLVKPANHAHCKFLSVGICWGTFGVKPHWNVANSSIFDKNVIFSGKSGN